MSDPGVNDGDTQVWRVGRTLGRTLYLQAGRDPDKGDVCVGLADTIPVARRVVDAMNGRPVVASPCVRARGRLVFLAEFTDPAREFSVCLDTPELAARVARALSSLSAPAGPDVDDTAW